MGWRDYETVVGITAASVCRPVQTRTVQGSNGRVQAKALTDHFVLLSVPDGSAEQALNLVIGVIWILALSQEHGRNTSVNVGKRRERRKQPDKDKIYRLSRGSAGPWSRLQC